MTLGLFLAFAAATGAPAGDTRVALVIGNDVGLADEEPLDYAEADARRVHELLVDVARVDRERAYLVVGGDADAVRAALGEVIGRLLELRQRGPSTLIVYASAHADESSLHLAGTRLPIAELRASMARAGADLRLLIVDGCRTAVRVKARGGAPASDVSVSFDRSVDVRGDLMIRSASNGEPAQEWTYLRGGLFTHHLLVGLRGVADIDRNGRVTLAEAYGYAYRNTVARAVATRGGAQHPSFDFDVRGFGEWVFARPERLGATVVLGPELAGVTQIADRKNELVAELAKVPGESVRIAVAPGWYRVVVADGAFADVADLNLAWGGTRALAPDDFVRTARSRTRLRGSEPIVLRPWGLSAGYALATGTVAGLAVEHRGDLRIARRWGSVYVRAGLAAGGGAFRAVRADVSQRSVRATLGGGYAVPLGFLFLRFGVALRAELVSQTVERDDAEEIERLLGQTEPDRRTFVLGAGAVAGVSVPITARFSIETEVEPALLRVPGAEAVSLRGVVEGRAGVAYAF